MCSLVIIPEHTKLSATGSTEEAGQSLYGGKQDCSAAIRAEHRHEEAAAKKASGTKAELVYLLVKGTKSRGPIMAYSISLLKGNGLLLHHEQAEQSKSLHPFLCDSWIMASVTGLRPFSSPEACILAEDSAGRRLWMLQSNPRLQFSAPPISAHC